MDCKTTNWLEVRDAGDNSKRELMPADLDRGECDAILMAQELRADALLIDDMPGRREAERRNLRFIGTLGILRAGARGGMLDFHAALDRLRRTNFHVSQELLDRLKSQDECSAEFGGRSSISRRLQST